MTLRLATPPEEIGFAARDLRRSVRVATAAKALDCSEGQIRQWMRDGVLETHGIGKRGKRIYVDSIEAYRAGTSSPAKATTRKPRKLPAEHHEAMAYLRSQGLV